MAMPDWTRDYLETVAEQIRWKAAQPVVLRELEDHLEDQCMACLEQGMTLQDARSESIRQMGDPDEVGRHLDAVHRPKHSIEIFSMMIGFLIFNLLLWMQVFFDGNWNQWLWTPLFAMAIGICAMITVYFLNWNWLLQRIGLFSILGWIVLLLIMENSLEGHSRAGDYAVHMMPILYVCALYRLRSKGLWGYLGNLFLLGVLFFLCLEFSVFLGTLFLFVTSLITGLLAVRHGAFGLKKGKVALILLPHTLFAALFCDQFFRQYSPDRDWPQDFSSYFHQILKHSSLIGAGKPFQTQLYHETVFITPKQSLMRTAEECDYFLTTIIYRCGWLVGLGLVSLLIGFLVFCLIKGCKQSSLWGKLLTCSIVVPMLLQTAMHTYNNLFGMIASVQLPLLSYGNTYRILDMLLLGLLLSMLRSRTILRDTPLKAA